MDINPGDRLADCGGLMQPIGVELKSGEYIITHRCVVCGHEKRNKAAEDDDIDAIIELSSRPVIE